MTTSLIDLGLSRPAGIQRRLSFTLETQTAQTRGPLFSLTPSEQLNSTNHVPSATKFPPLHTGVSLSTRTAQYNDVAEDPAEEPATRQSQQLPAIITATSAGEVGEPEEGEGAVAALLDDSGDDSDSESDIAEEETELAPAESLVLPEPEKVEHPAPRRMGSISLGPASRFSMGGVKFGYPLPLSDHYTVTELKDANAALFKARIAELNRLERLSIRKEPWAFAAWKRLTGRRSHPNEL